MEAVQAGEYEVLADEASVQLKAGLGGPIEALYPNLRPPSLNTICPVVVMDPTRRQGAFSLALDI
ncbi:hypothetical protein [Arthrobacter sp. ISL-85]|uniref:hypothetical protein n=1 Tax=Arthrobacter sp. ISL-85 TaxID=2819115 RepID=UPI00203611C0|nr:hypothetical protein [Arthrobacter sp. ISL-85]